MKLAEQAIYLLENSLSPDKLWTGEGKRANVFLCVAVLMTNWDNFKGTPPNDSEARADIVRRINIHIGNSFSLRAWHFNNTGVALEAVEYQNMRRELAHKLIAEYKEMT